MDNYNYTEMFRSYNVPEHNIEGLVSYVEAGKPVGGFLTALLANDFVMTVGRADPTNRAALVELSRALCNVLPSACWGSYKAVNAWIEQGGELGQ